MFYFFFFQAEDGIRDDLVTGVQTCALPILHQPGHAKGGGEQEQGRENPRDLPPDPAQEAYGGVTPVGLVSLHWSITYHVRRLSGEFRKLPGIQDFRKPTDGQITELDKNEPSDARLSTGDYR